MKEFWCDLETTGTDPNRNGIWQIAFIVVDGSKRIESSYTLRPLSGDVIENRALEVGGTTIDELKTYADAKKVFIDMQTELKTWVDPYNKADKFHFYGYNAQFDSGFLRRFFEKMGDKYFGSWFWTPPIDVMTIAAYHLREQRDTMLNFKLRTVAKVLGVEIDDSKLHDALYDIQLTRQILSNIERR
jgi:DNA polymerase-3 subunit epsilon